MRFMLFVKSGHVSPPTPAMVEAIGQLAEREMKAGRLVDMGGLLPMPMGAQVALKGGKISVTDGPFVEAKEVVGGYAIFELPDKEAALASAREFMQLHIEHMPGWEGLCELRPMAGP